MDAQVVLLAVIAALPVTIAAITGLVIALKTHSLVNQRMTDALSKISSLEGQIVGMKHDPPPPPTAPSA
jgi:hypothetical protein